MNVTILANMKKDKNGDALQLVLDSFKDRADVKVVTDYISRKDFDNADVAVVLGGDGTIIRAAKCAAPLNVPVCGINLGKIGFLASSDVEEFKKISNMLLTKNYQIENRMILKASVNGRNERLVLNDIAVFRGSCSKMINISVDVDGEFLDEFLADGVVVATPTGSTAYSLSAGGPVAMPTMEMILVTPICAYDMHARSIVLPSEKVVALTLDKRRNFTAEISFDGSNNVPFTNKDVLQISKADFSAKLVNFGNRSFYGVLRKKLGK